MPEAAIAALVDGLQFFGLGASWGGYESLILPTCPSNYRTINAEKWTAPMLRLHVGLEAVEDLLADLEVGFSALRTLPTMAQVA